ncbi:MAG: carbohydrate ABC transporter permease [Geminicoccales bacterium]
MSRRGAASWLQELLFWAALALAALFILVPFLWVASAAFKRRIDLLVGKIVFEPVLSNFNELFFSRGSDFALNFANSMIVGIASTAIVLLITSMTAYTMHRFRWPRWVTPALFLWAVFFHMIPGIVIVSAWFVMFQYMGLLNTYLGLVLGHVTHNLPIGLFLMSAFVREVPQELEEAAQVDGAGPAGVFFRVVMPVILPGLIATAIIVFVFSWNEFPIALNLTNRATQTVPVAIAKFAQEYEIRFGEMAAGALLSTLPALLLLIVGQRYIVRGLTAGALK